MKVVGGEEGKVIQGGGSSHRSRDRQEYRGSKKVQGFIFLLEIP